MLIVAALCASIAVLITHPGMLKYPFGWWTLALIVGVAAFPIGTFFLYSTTVKKITAHSSPLHKAEIKMDIS